MSSTPPGRSHRLLDKLFTEPRQLLEVARLHHHALRKALDTGDLDTIRPAFINFVMVVHAIPEWVEWLAPQHKEAVRNLTRKHPSIRTIRDLAVAVKHGPMTRSDPLEVEEARQTLASSQRIGPAEAVSTKVIVRESYRIKVLFRDGEAKYMDDVADETMRRWDQFFSEHGIA